MSPMWVLMTFYDKLRYTVVSEEESPLSPETLSEIRGRVMVLRLSRKVVRLVVLAQASQ